MVYLMMSLVFVVVKVTAAGASSLMRDLEYLPRGVCPQLPAGDWAAGWSGRARRICG